MFARSWRRTRTLVLLVLILLISLIQFLNIEKKGGVEIEFIKDLILKRTQDCDLDHIFNLIMLKKRYNIKNCQYSYKDLSGLLGIYEISQENYYLKKSLEIVAQDSQKFNTPSGIPSFNSSIVSIDILSYYSLEYYYLGDLTFNFTLLDQVEKGLKTINSLIDLNRTVKNINIQNPFKLIEKDKPKPSKLYPVLLKLWISTGNSLFKEMYDKALGLITPFITNITLDECYFPGILTQGALLDRDKDWTFNLNLAHTIQDVCVLQKDSEICGVLDFEHLFYMYRLTNHGSWRDLAWEYISIHGDCLDSKSLRFAYLIFSGEFSLEQYIFSNGYPLAVRGFGRRTSFLPSRESGCYDCVDGYGLDALLNGAFST